MEGGGGGVGGGGGGGVGGGGGGGQWIMAGYDCTLLSCNYQRIESDIQT